MGTLVPLVESYGVNVRVNKPTVPAELAHFTRIGYTIESKAGGTDVLCKCVLHFN